MEILDKTHVSGSQGGHGLLQGWQGLEVIKFYFPDLFSLELNTYHHGMQGTLQGLEHPQAFICDGCW